MTDSYEDPTASRSQSHSGVSWRYSNTAMKAVLAAHGKPTRRERFVDWLFSLRWLRRAEAE
jgi:hypothetical protein